MARPTTPVAAGGGAPIQQPQQPQQPQLPGGGGGGGARAIVPPHPLRQIANAYSPAQQAQQQQQQAQPPQAQPPPQSDWAEYSTPEGRKYYYNRATKSTTWEKPDELKSDSERAIGTCVWKEYRTPEGRPYYYNTATKVSAWSMPDEYRDWLSKQKPAAGDAAASSDAAASNNKTATPQRLPPQAAVASPSASASRSPSTPRSLASSSSNSNVHIASPAGDGANGSSTPGRGAPTPAAAADAMSAVDSLLSSVRSKPIKDEESELVQSIYQTSEPGKRVFWMLLRQLHVEPDWPWERALKEVMPYEGYKVRLCPCASNSDREREQASHSLDD